jgi:phage portal protein BeeE
MPNLVDRALATVGLKRFQPYTPEEIAALWGSGQVFNQFMTPGFFPQTTMGSKTENPIGGSFSALTAGAYSANPIVFACILARVQLFSEARFKFQAMKNGIPGELFNNPATYLSMLEEPWPGGTTSMLLKDALVDSDIGGNAFIARRPEQLQRLRPDWTVIIAGSTRSNATTWDLDTEILGYGYQPDGPTGGKEKIYLQRSEVAHFRPIPDPNKRFSGMSWLVPVIREIMGDQSATTHKLKYFDNAATPNMAVKFDQVMNEAQAKDWIKLFAQDHAGAANAYKTLFLGGGASMEVIGANLRQADFSQVQGGGELRIASAAGVPPIVIGLSGGLSAATYSNYQQARRAFADLTMRPLWRDMAGALEQITQVPANSRLWYDASDISFLQEDQQDAANIEATKAQSIRTLLDSGFTAQTVIDAINASDITRLKHSGLFSVQLQAPGSTKMPAGEVPGEIPVGVGTKPEVLPAKAESTKAPAVATPLTKANASSITGEIRCTNCDKLLAERATEPYRITCYRCKTTTESGTLAAA